MLKRRHTGWEIVNLVCIKTLYDIRSGPTAFLVSKMPIIFSISEIWISILSKIVCGFESRGWSWVLESSKVETDVK